MQNFLNISQQVLDLSAQAERDCAEAFSRIEQIEQVTGQRVLGAFLQNGVMASHLSGSTGYGYGDIGRDMLDRVFATAIGAEDAIVRSSFASGTHALTVALFGLLRPNDRLVCITGEPYDTLAGVIGLGESHDEGSLADFGVRYHQIELVDGKMDIESAIKEAADAKVIYIQRSRGYSLRPSLSVEEIGDAIKKIKAVHPDVIIMVDNCYGEFVEEREPTAVGADLMAGSLIKNPGGGIAKTGGYIAGRSDLVEKCAFRLTTPGTGREVGCSLDENRNMFLGLFFAPTVVAAALKTAVFAAALIERMGYVAIPSYTEPRRDIIQSLCLENAEALCAFCRGIQNGSPIDSLATPEPWDMPGYDSQVIMAAGAFTLGASIELSADAPMREPFAVWLQGGLTYPTGKAGVMIAAQQLLDHKAQAK